MQTALVTILKIISPFSLSIRAPRELPLSLPVLSEPPPNLFFCPHRFCLPPLCFNCEKQAPTHLSALAYLQPHCVLRDLSTTQVTWVGGVEVCGGVGVTAARGGTATPIPMTCAPLLHCRKLAADNKSLTTRDSESVSLFPKYIHEWKSTSVD